VTDMATDDSWVPTLPVEGVDSEFPSMVTVGDVEMVLCRSDDGFFALGNICSHAYARLSDGHTEGNQVFCPLHQGSFDIRTGEAVASPCYEPIATYPTKIDGGIVFVCPVANRLKD
jgi:naphthalene 1,2-dioxygenase system ferredoxin subunit